MANYGTKRISGWYYDFQRDPEKSRMTTGSLHSNYVPKATGSGGGGSTSGKNAGGGSAPQGDGTDKTARKWDPVSGAKDEDGYAIKPLCTSILTDDFNVGAANNWSDFGSDPASEIWSQIKPLAPYAQRVGEVLHNLKTQNQGIPLLFRYSILH